jgi:regulator of sigma E protease
MFLRDIKSVTVKRLDGDISRINIPENIGQKMFQSGDMISFRPVAPVIIDSVIPNSPAMDVGLIKGDEIKKINDEKFIGFDAFKDILKSKNSEQISIEIDRNGRAIEFDLTTTKTGEIGFYPSNSFISFTNKELSIRESIVEGYDYGYWTLHDYIYQFKYIFTKKGASQLGGFGTIGSLFPSSWDWKGFWHSTALISIILAFMNVLPIPALDGGHVMFLLYEIVSGRKANDKFMEYAQVFGFFLLLSLVLFANGNDIYRAVFN